MSRDETSTPRQLREAGLRVTAARCVVLDWLAEHPHATVEQTGAGVRERLGSLSKQAVYDVLSACVAAGLVRHIRPAGHASRFERRTGDNHHHLVCRGCGAIADVDCVAGAGPCLEPDSDRGFTVDAAEVIFWGSCPACRGDATADAGSTDLTRNEQRVGRERATRATRKEE